ncbi:hypothetical protein ACVIU7_006436 [Bradyrhizobium liaoningense]
MDHHVVRPVERLATRLLGQGRDRAVVLVADEAGALGAELATLGVERVAVGFVRRLVELLGDMAVIVEIAKLPVGGDVAPDQILSLRIPRRPFRPKAARVEPLDRGVADLGLEALGVDDDDVGVWITLRLGIGAEVAGIGLRGQQGRCGDSCRAP